MYAPHATLYCGPTSDPNVLLDTMIRSLLSPSYSAFTDLCGKRNKQCLSKNEQYLKIKDSYQLFVLLWP